MPNTPKTQQEWRVHSINIHGFFLNGGVSRSLQMRNRGLWMQSTTRLNFLRRMDPGAERRAPSTSGRREILPMSEYASLSSVRKAILISLIGYCFGNPRRALDSSCLRYRTPQEIRPPRGGAQAPASRSCNRPSSLQTRRVKRSFSGAASSDSLLDGKHLSGEGYRHNFHFFVLCVLLPSSP